MPAIRDGLVFAEVPEQGRAEPVAAATGSVVGGVDLDEPARLLDDAVDGGQAQPAAHPAIRPGPEAEPLHRVGGLGESRVLQDTAAIDGQVVGALAGADRQLEREPLPRFVPLEVDSLLPALGLDPPGVGQGDPDLARLGVETTAGSGRL